MTRRDRMEARLERRRTWAAGRQQRAETALKASTAAADRVPLGQPILVGHHSEGAMRRHYDGVQRLTMAALDNRAMAAHHEAKADGIERALAHTIFSDDEDAPDRLRLRIAQLCTKRDAIKAHNKAAKTADDRLPAYVLTNLSANIRRLQKRLAALGG